MTSLTVNGASTIGASATSLRTTGTQYYGGAVMLGVDPTFTASTVTFNNTVDGAEALAITGAAVFNGEVGTNNQLTSLSVSGASTINTDALDTSTTQTYTGPVTLTDSSTLTATLVTFQNEVDGAYSLTISNAATFDGNVGSDAPLTSLSVNGASTFSTASLTTSGDQTYTGAVTLQSSATLHAGTGTVAFGATVDSAGSTPFNLNVADSGSTGFGGAVGDTNALNALTVNAAGALTLDGNVTAARVTLHSGTAGSGDLTLGAITVAADSQSYRAGNGSGAADTGARVDLVSNSPTLTNEVGSAGPTTLTYRQDASIADADLPIATQFLSGLPTTYTIRSDDGSVTVATDSNVNSSGTALFLNANQTLTISAAVDVASVQATAGSGITLNTASVTTSAAQSYTGAVTLAQAATLTGSGVTFNGTVDGTGDGGQNLTVNDSGTTTFGAAVGGNNALASLTTGSGGTVTLDNVTTSGAQTYNNAVTLNGIYTTSSSAFTITSGTTTLVGASTISTGSANVTFGGTVDGGYSLTVTGNTVFDGAVGQSANLTSLSVCGTSALNGALRLRSSTDQTYTGAVTLGASVALSTGTLVTFSSTVDGTADGAGQSPGRQR